MQRKHVIWTVIALSVAALLLLLQSRAGGRDGELTQETGRPGAVSAGSDPASHVPGRASGGEDQDPDGRAAGESRSIQGRVIDEGDRPIPGAEVRLTAFGLAEVGVVSGPGGAFLAEVGEALPLLISASAEGYLRGSMTIRTYTDDIEIVLRRGRELSGMVVLGEEPVAGATVVAGSARVMSGAGGVFMFQDLSAGPVSVEARRLMARSEPTRLDLSLGPVHGLVLRLEESGSLEVRVRTGSDVPVQNAMVRVSPMGWDEAFELSTGDDGNVLFDPAPWGSVRVTASAQGLASAEKNTEVPIGERRVAWLNLAEAHALVVNTRLDRGTPSPGETVTLRLVRADGSPIHQAARHQQSAGIGEPAVFESVGAGSWRAIAHHPNYSASPVPVEVPGPDVTIVLETGKAVSGRVVDEEGAPLTGAFVIATPALVPGASRTELRPARRGRSDAGGVFRIEGLTGDGWSLVPRMNGYSFGRPVPVRAGEENVLLRMEKARVIAGQVVDGRGVPLPSVRVVARATYGDRRRVATAATGEDGDFRFENLSAGSYEVVASRGQRASDAQTIAAGQERVTLIIPVGATLRGRVVGPGGSAPPRYTVLGFSFSEPSGSFEIVDLDPREATVWVDAPQLLRKVVEVALRDDRVTDLGTVSLDAPASIDGSVQGEDGRGIAGATVVLEIREGSDSHPAITSTDSEGRFSFASLRLGDARLHVQAEGEQSAAVQAVLRSGETARVRIVVP